jgi:hypothetical protein
MKEIEDPTRTLMSSKRLQMRFAIILGVVCATVSQAQGGPVAKAVRVLDAAEVTALAPKVRSIHATPATITLRVGETVQLSAITVTAVDSAGRTRGQLAGYDFSIKPGEPAEVVPRHITGKRPGQTDLIVRYPRMAWKARSDPRVETKIHVIVKP